MVSLASQRFTANVFFIYSNIFRRLKLEIALAIPASNEWKIITKHSVARTTVIIESGQSSTLYLPLLSSHCWSDLILHANTITRTTLVGECFYEFARKEENYSTCVLIRTSKLGIDQLMDLRWVSVVEGGQIWYITRMMTRTSLLVNPAK